MTANNGSSTVAPANAFQPQLIAFCCNFCAYAAADLAGSLRLSYPPDIHVILLPCTGRLDELEVLHAVERGADGILVAGCLEGDCHFQQGNLNARRRVEHIQRLLEQIGLERGRVRMANLSSAMASEFARVAADFSAQIHELGPSPLRSMQPIASTPETIGNTG
jgi:coenzyme F420-reducing hydrogenase delta subunit